MPGGALTKLTSTLWRKPMINIKTVLTSLLLLSASEAQAAEPNTPAAPPLDMR
jgi:hypothetical protein